MEKSKENINFEEIERKYDPQLSFRKLGPKINIIIILTISKKLKTIIEV